MTDYEAKAKEAHDTHVSIVLDAIKAGTWDHAATWLEIAEIAVTALEDDGITFARTTEETP
jgi:hypothetical protein